MIGSSIGGGDVGGNGVLVGIGVFVGVEVGVSVGVFVAVGVGVSVGVGLGVYVGVDVYVAVAVGVRVSLNTLTCAIAKESFEGIKFCIGNFPNPTNKPPRRSKAMINQGKTAGLEWVKDCVVGGCMKIRLCLLMLYSEVRYL